MASDLTTRRELLKRAAVCAASGALSALLPERPALGQAAASAPALPVAIERCDSYALPLVTQRLSLLMDRIGGLKRLAAGKTVVVKVNLTGSPGGPTLGLPASRTYQVHPHVVVALAVLLDRAGARRIRFVEGTYTTQPLEQTLQRQGWDLSAFSTLHAPVEFEDTRNRGQGRSYHAVRVPWGGDLYPSYWLNHAYVDCDTYISLAKLKNHFTAGVTLSMKNNFGITPTALYAQPADDENSTDSRISVIHEGQQKPAPGLPAELPSHSPQVPSHRVPRHILDANGIRPIDLALIDGIETVSGGEGPWCPALALQRPHLLLAGRNAVCTDAIATVCMGYDPLAAAATGPFPGANHLNLAARRGLGTNDPKRIEIVGLSLAQARHPFGWQPKQTERNT